MKTLLSTIFTLVLTMGLTTFAHASENITPIGELKRGSMVTVQGTVERITDEDEFRLADATGSVRVYVGPNWVPVSQGASVTVSGFVDDDIIGPKEIYARSLTKADGTEVKFNRGYY